MLHEWAVASKATPSVQKDKESALAGVAQWIEHGLQIASSIPGEGTCLVCGPHERQPHIDVSLPLFSLPPPSLTINK